MASGPSLHLKFADSIVMSHGFWAPLAWLIIPRVSKGRYYQSGPSSYGIYYKERYAFIKDGFGGDSWWQMDFTESILGPPLSRFQGISWIVNGVSQGIHDKLKFLNWITVWACPSGKFKQKLFWSRKSLRSELSAYCLGAHEPYAEFISAAVERAWHLGDSTRSYTCILCRSILFFFFKTCGADWRKFDG